MNRETYIHQLTPARAGWVKHPGGAVLGGDLGTCFDISVLAEDGKFKMIFSWRPEKSIALTESADGIHWGKPLILLGPRETPEHWEDDINRPSVVKHNGLYHMWYTGQYPGHLSRAVDGRSWLFYATSPDLLHWQRASLEPVLCAETPWEKVAVMCPNVLWDDTDNLYKMWYCGGEQYEPDAFGYATSPDGLHWTKHPANPVFTADPSHAWEQHKVGGCQVLYQDGWYLLFYIGYWDEDTAQIGIARSRDGITGWKRHPLNPVIAPGENQWDADATYKPFALFDGQRWRLWYNGRRAHLEQIGLATHDGEDLGF
jgi:beta-1,2-mannobiose phosphorylase / 1,2-beta-oligomannan phosphorylase